MHEAGHTNGNGHAGDETCTSRDRKPAARGGAAKAAGGLRFHDLRHCYATWLVSGGVPVNVVQVVMGHEQASTTLNRYTHTPADFFASVRAVFSDRADDSLTAKDDDRSMGDVEAGREDL